MADDRDGVWRLWLTKDGALAGELVVDPARGDFPWLQGEFEPTPAFGAVAPLFARELALLDDLDESTVPSWEAVQDEICAATRLTLPDGRDVPEYLLHIDGDHAWWRWHDEPFEG